MRSESLSNGLPLAVAAIALTAGLALWLAISVLGQMPAVTPELPRFGPSVDTQTSPPRDGGTAPNAPAGPANQPATTPAPAPEKIPPAPGQVQRPERPYGDMPIDPPNTNRDPRPVED